VIWFTRASCGPAGWKFNFFILKKNIMNCYNIFLYVFCFFYVMIFFKIIFIDFIFEYWAGWELLPHKTLWIVTVFPSIFCFVLFFYDFFCFLFFFMIFPKLSLSILFFLILCWLRI
jgi:hypothetical protein